jgi:hypothetical protein
VPQRPILLCGPEETFGDRDGEKCAEFVKVIVLNVQNGSISSMRIFFIR